MGPLEGVLLMDRYLVSYLIDKGSQGTVHKVIDTQDSSVPLVVKFQNKLTPLQQEIETMS